MKTSAAAPSYGFDADAGSCSGACGAVGMLSSRAAWGKQASSLDHWTSKQLPSPSFILPDGSVKAAASLDRGFAEWVQQVMTAMDCLQTALSRHLSQKHLSLSMRTATLR